MKGKNRPKRAKKRCQTASGLWRVCNYNPEDSSKIKRSCSKPSSRSHEEFCRSSPFFSLLCARRSVFFTLRSLAGPTRLHPQGKGGSRFWTFLYLILQCRCFEWYLNFTFVFGNKRIWSRSPTPVDATWKKDAILSTLEHSISREWNTLPFFDFRCFFSKNANH